MNIDILKELIIREFNRNENNLSKILDEVLRVVDLYHRSKEGGDKKSTEPIDFKKFKEQWFDIPQQDFNDPCSACSNNPKNGGSGICHCTAPSRDFTCQYFVK